MKRKLISLTASLSTLAVLACVHGADALLPLAPFYPEAKKPGIYDPGKFVPSSEAKAVLPQGMLRENDFSSIISLDGNWKISALENSKEPFPQNADIDKGFAEIGFNDSGWNAIKVPLNWYSRFPNAVQKTAPYVKGWYRKTIEIPGKAAGQRTIVHFNVVGYEALLFVNGKEAGRHHGDFTPWSADITDFVVPGKPATIAMRVFSDLGPNFGARPEAKHAYGSQWSTSNIKGGIWQHCELRLEPQIRITETLVSPDPASSSINVECVIRNDSTSSSQVELYAAINPAEASLAKEPGKAMKISPLKLEKGETKFSFNVKLEKPRLWSPDNPVLYHLSIPLLINGKTVSLKTVRFGFRSFKVKNDHFLLNGDFIYLFGENEKALKFGGDGESVDSMKDRAAADLLNFKALGYNTVRNPHMPFAPEVLEVADEVGMMIYDEWCWCFGNKLDPAAFEKNNLEEVAEWVRRDYNNPCVVMWSGGNEIKCDKSIVEVFDKQTKLIRSLDRSGRPVSVFSGSAGPEFAKDLRLDTDLLDLHSYIGLGPRPWTYWNRDFNQKFEKDIALYSKDGKSLGIPYVAWELVGFSWGGKYDKFIPGDVEAYLKWAKGPTDWGNPNGIGWAGAIGLDAALDSKRGGRYGMETIGRRIMEYVRQDMRVCGFAPWFHGTDLAAATLWTQPVYCGLRSENGLPLRNIFSGKTYRQQVFAVNASKESYKDAVTRISLTEANGDEKLLTEWHPGELNSWQKATGELDLQIPDSKSAMWAQIRVRTLAKDGSEISRNFYDVFIQNWEEAMAPVETKFAIGILSCKSSGAERLKEILGILKINHVEVSTPETLASCQTLIVPPSEHTPEISVPMSEAVSDWVKKGGTLLALEQAWDGEFPLISKKLNSTQVIFVDLVIPSHPAFKGLSQANFEFWNNPSFGQTGGYVLSPLAEDVVAAKGPMCSKKETFAVLSDGKLGQGRIIASQFDACSLWGVDSAASVYLRNLLSSALSTPPPSIKALK